MLSGLEHFLGQVPTTYKNARVGLCCNPTAVDRQLRHAIELLPEAGVRLSRIFGPEHGVFAAAQDMISVHDEGPEVVSLYGNDEASLHPTPESLADLDVLLFDIQDIGARYYTYQATLGFMMEVAGKVDTKVVVLDRPNPINGVDMEGNIVLPGFESFVSAYPLAIRHGMTMGEMARYFQRYCGLECELEVVQCQGWRRDQWFDDGDLPWVLPSPNMPTLDTAIIYPGMCLIEGTNLSEGRGTTRPFHLIGAPWLDPDKMVRLCRQGAEDCGLTGVGFRAASFEPQFQKHAGQLCGGVELHIQDRNALESVLLGLVVIEAAMRCNPDAFAWRTETYEYVDDPIAIDLLFGSAEGRVALESRVSLRELTKSWEAPRLDWLPKRARCLLYE